MAMSDIHCKIITTSDVLYIAKMCKKPLKNVQEPTEKNCCETFFIGLKSNLPHKTGFPHRIITGLLV